MYGGVSNHHGVSILSYSFFDRLTLVHRRALCKPNAVFLSALPLRGKAPSPCSISIRSGLGLFVGHPWGHFIGTSLSLPVSLIFSTMLHPLQ